jgi:hypothetical protein
MIPLTCSICGHTQAEGAMLCCACGADLTLASGGDAGQAGAKPREGVSAPVETGADRTCAACGGVNAGWAVLCSGCGQDLLASSGQVEGKGGELWLVVRGRHYRCAPGDVLGREGTVAGGECLEVGTVHRRHVQLCHGDTGWRLVVLGGVRNLTALDGEGLRPGEERLLSGRHRLQLSRAFEVSLCVGGPSWDGGATSGVVPG